MKLLTENDYKILTRFTNAKDKMGLSKANGITRKYLMDVTNLSYTKIREGVNLLLEYQFLEVGISKGRERTYYLTEKGMVELRSIAELSIKVDKGENVNE